MAERSNSPNSADRASSSDAATEFFERPRTAEERERLTAQLSKVTPTELLNEWAEHSALARRAYSRLHGETYDPATEETLNRREAARARNSTRATEWARKYPERARENARRYQEKNPERVRETQRRSYQRNREKILEKSTQYRDANEATIRERNRREREKNRDYRAQLQRDYRANPENYKRTLENNKLRRRLIRRLERAGLPPRRLHSETAAQRRAAASAAEEFFHRKRTPGEKKQIKREYVATPPELIERWTRFSALARRRSQDMEAMETYLQRHGERLKEEIELDSRARQARGAAPLDVDKELSRRARETLRGLRPAPAGRVARRRAPDPHTGTVISPDGARPSHGPSLY